MTKIGTVSLRPCVLSLVTRLEPRMDKSDNTASEQTSKDDTVVEELVYTQHYNGADTNTWNILYQPLMVLRDNYTCK